MASLTVRQLDDKLKRLLRLRAAQLVKARHRRQATGAWRRAIKDAYEPPMTRAYFSFIRRSAVPIALAATVALLGARSSATVGDVRRDLRGRQATLMPQFDTVAAPFVRRAYAERAIGVQDWNRAQASFIALKSAAERPVSKGQNE